MSCPECNQTGEALGRIYLNIDEEEVETHLSTHREFLTILTNRMEDHVPLAANQEQDVFDFPRFEVRMFVNREGISIAPIPPPDADEYMDDANHDGFAEVDWVVPHLDLRIRVNQEAMAISRYIDNDTDSSNDDDSSDDEYESMDESSDDELNVHQ